MIVVVFAEKLRLVTFREGFKKSIDWPALQSHTKVDIWALLHNSVFCNGSITEQTFERICIMARLQLSQPRYRVTMRSD